MLLTLGRYLQEAILAVMNAMQCHDPTAVEHAPRVLGIAVRQLQAFQTANPSGIYCRQVRFLIVTATSAMAKA